MPKKGKGEKKGGGGGGGKAKDPGPTNVEQEELRVKIAALEDKLLRSTQKLEEMHGEYDRAKVALEKQQADQQDIVGYLKKEIEKKAAENAALEKKYISIREAKENEELRLKHELTLERNTGGSLRDQHEAAVNEKSRLEDRLIEYNQLKEQSHTNKALIESLTQQLESTKGLLAQAQQQLHILHAPESYGMDEQGGGAIPLLLLEAIRAYASKPLLIEQACYALQAVLKGERVVDCVLVRQHKGIELVLDAMRAHEGHAALQAGACGLLWKLAFSDPPTRKLIVAAGGVQTILHGMQSHLNNPRLQYSACGALRNLLVHGAQEFSVSSQIPGVRPGETLPSISTPTSLGESRDKRRAVPKVGGVRAVSNRKSPPNSSGGLKGSRSLPMIGGTHRKHDERDVRSRQGRPESLSPSPPRRDGLPEVTPAARDSVLEQALELTLRSMSEHADQSLVQEYGCGTLWNLVMANPPLKAHVADVRGVRLVLEAMRAHPMQTGVQLNASAVLKEFASHPRTLEQMKAGDAREALRSAVSNHPFNNDLIKVAEEAIHCLPSMSAALI